MRVNGSLYLAFVLTLLSTQSMAYVGPGAGLSMIGSLVALLGGILMAVGVIVLWPIRRLIKRRKSNGSAGQEREAQLAQPDLPDAKRQTAEMREGQ